MKKHRVSADKSEARDDSRVVEQVVGHGLMAAARSRHTAGPYEELLSASS
jgi:hypothetical protein